MRGMMMDFPLLISSILRHAALYHGDTEIVSRSAEGSVRRYTYADLSRRSGRLAHALKQLGLVPGDRVGTLAWNGFRHLELYYGVSGSGLVCHTINPRLFPEQIAGIIAHARDSVLFVDPCLVGSVEVLADKLADVRAIVVMTDAESMPVSTRLPGLLCYESLIEAQPDDFDWPHFDEHTASGLCYTSGTTGAPKGVLYTHRSCVLHAMAVCAPDVFGLAAAETAMPVVPMFHVNAWGFPYAAVMAGCKLVLPGPKLDGASLADLISHEGVTLAAGVPTVWMGVLDYVRSRGTAIEPLRKVVIGGSACPAAMIERFRERGVEVVHAWGMTETSSAAVASRPKAKHFGLAPEASLARMAKQGRPMFGVDVRLVGSEGADIPCDGASYGRLLVRGFAVASRYFGAQGDAAFAEPGWFDTGDVATVDADGFVQIVDRTKDVIRSGGEWISSIELENIAVAHPAVREAAVVARPDPLWGERPVLFVVLHEGMDLGPSEVSNHFAGRVAKWCVPTDLRIVSDLPHTATGKLHKLVIRQMV